MHVINLFIFINVCVFFICTFFKTTDASQWYLAKNCIVLFYKQRVLLLIFLKIIEQQQTEKQTMELHCQTL